MGKFKYRKGSSGIHNITERSPEYVAGRKHSSMLRRDIVHKLKNNEKLTGNMLSCALRVADGSIAEKLRKGEPLDDFEQHLIVDVLLSNMIQERAG